MDRPGAAAQRIFLSSTCLDLVDLRSGLMESLEELGHQVWASEFPDFPVDSRLHPEDNSLRNVEQADQYVLIVNDRYGSTYEGPAYPRHPLPEEPRRTVSITWHEYLRALVSPNCSIPSRQAKHLALNSDALETRSRILFIWSSDQLAWHQPGSPLRPKRARILTDANYRL